MTRGLIDAGINVLCGIDSNPACKQTYEYNNSNTYLLKNICQFTPKDVLAQFPQIKNKDDLLLVGCAPCQPFSILRREAYDTEGNIIPHKSVNLLIEFSRFVRNRRRYILIASQKFKLVIPNATYGEGLQPYNTVRQAISKYPPLSAGEENLTIPNHIGI